MPADGHERRVYHVSPWRRYVLWYLVGPMILAMVIGSAFGPPDARAALLVTAGLTFLIMLPFEFILTRTQLILSPEGVCLKQTGYTLEASWAEICGLRLDRGQEGFITTEPLRGKGAARLASFRGTGIGAPLYTPEQQALLAERRLIPIEAFAWHLRRGKLRNDIVGFAPHLKDTLDALDAPAAPAPASTEQPTSAWKKLLAVLFWLAVFTPPIALAFSPEPMQQTVIRVATAVCVPLFALRAAVGAWSSFRRRAWLYGVFLLVLTAVLMVWSVGAWLALEKMWK